MSDAKEVVGYDRAVLDRDAVAERIASHLKSLRAEEG